MSQLLIINAGSTSTKIGIFDGNTEVASHTLRHEASVIGSFHSVIDQYEWRIEEIKKVLADQGEALDSFDAYVGRGGLLKPIKSGTYRVNEAMLADLKKSIKGEHASNLGAMIAQGLATEYGKEAFIADPVVVDERYAPVWLVGLAHLDNLPTQLGQAI